MVRGGEVVVRPVQRFQTMRQLPGQGQHLVAETITEKLDGVMVCGVVVGDAVELWSRGGWTEQAVSATRFAIGLPVSGVVCWNWWVRCSSGEGVQHSST